MDEVGFASEPEVGLRLAQRRRQGLRGNQTAPGGAAAKGRFAITKPLPAHRRAQAVGADQQAGQPGAAALSAAGDDLDTFGGFGEFGDSSVGKEIDFWVRPRCARA